MTVTLYSPDHLPQQVQALPLTDGTCSFALVDGQIATLLNCRREPIDVLAKGPGMSYTRCSTVKMLST